MKLRHRVQVTLGIAITLAAGATTASATAEFDLVLFFWSPSCFRSAFSPAPWWKTSDGRSGTHELTDGFTLRIDDMWRTYSPWQEPSARGQLK